ncbi:cytochrome c oxidase subunit 2A [Guptibacillus algicola]|uniref:cytochrome c oxidase subunit 2A n=1 Tax=Guptibacillus algicola TaxID=225844 RepID=UPI001CD5BB6E|nr:cytochrome c oxidase subunit 2A [Alkalihalobacillus algicola]MCA0986472.1 cytochrome c oxidase subunit 2A [Alkalihalobacillus algicola]
MKLVNSKTESQPVKIEKSEEDLKGTIISVFMVGGFIALSWAGVYLLFVARF